ncbi:gp90 [Corynebacterium phage P1201]|uniref:Gp90 n=1 Tax=Corynebacterium phage P1201 TaxID=384848 RepID=A7IYF7_9CAUD|nr:gp90 [Corynebacterium phage P1201]ABF57540.1 gp90 [Corynebacterium phage P1201]
MRTRVIPAPLSVCQLFEQLNSCDIHHLKIAWGWFAFFKQWGIVLVIGNENSRK